jgi:hypothetical protein
MAKKRSKRGHPLLLFWSKREAMRFNENVERFASLVNDMEAILASPKRRRAAQTPPVNGGKPEEVQP